MSNATKPAKTWDGNPYAREPFREGQYVDTSSGHLAVIRRVEGGRCLVERVDESCGGIVTTGVTQWEPACVLAEVPSPREMKDRMAEVQSRWQEQLTREAS